MPTEAAVLRQIRDFTRTPWHKLASLLALVVILSSVVITSVSFSVGNVQSSAVRDALKQPFSQDSIWNLPIGASASYVWAGIRHATAQAYFTDADVLVLTPSAPAQAVFTNYDDWGAGTRCASSGPALFTVPIPAGFVIPGNHAGSPDGDTPNAATAILAADGHTIIQTQPFAKCPGVAPTSHYVFGNEDLYGTGVTGSHGGSGLSALGGTVRLGELVPGGIIPHALKLNIDSSNFYPGFAGYRWPAWKSDAGGAGYSGSIPEVRMGSLLAVRPDFSVATLETEPGRIIASAFRNYGAYIVDTSGWSIYNFVTERSPSGSVQDEFLSRWGYTLNAGVGANGWARDLDKIFMNLWNVNNWDYPTWQTVSASKGLIGAGLGAPLVPWAPVIGGTITPPPPPPSATLIMAAGDSNTQGAGSPGGYRTSLYQSLTTKGFSFHMVGSQSDGPPELIEKAHEGWGGYTIDNLTAILPGKLTLNPPNTVLLLIGTNDAANSVDMVNAPSRLGKLLDLILARPTVQRVIVSTLPPFNLAWPAGQQAIQTFNAAIPALVSARAKVSMIDLYPQIVAATDMADGVHLNAAGAAKLGALFVNSVLGTPQPPTPPPPPPPVVPAMSGDFHWTKAGRMLNFSVDAWNGASPYRFMMSYGDGTVSPWSSVWGTIFSHTFSATGLYRVTMTVADSAGAVLYLSKDVSAG